MENIEQLSAFYKRRGFTGRLFGGYMLLEKNFSTILRTGSFVLIPYAIVMAVSLVWLFDTIQTVVSPANMAAWMQTPGAFADALLPVAMQGLVCFLVLLIGMCVWQALVFGMFRKYMELGYVPSMKMKAWFSWMSRDIWRYFLYALFSLFFWIVVEAILYMLVTVNGWLGLVMLPVMLYCAVIFLLFPYFYMIERETLWDAFLHAFRKGTPTWGTTFSIGLVAGIIVGVFTLICSMPMYVTVLIDNLVAKSIIDGNVPELPSYYVALKILCYAIYVYAGALGMVFVESPLLFHYASVVSPDKEKMLADARAEYERLKAERARQAAEKEREAAIRDGAAYKPW